MIAGIYVLNSLAVIDGLMISVLTASAVDRMLEPWSGQIIDNKIGIVSQLNLQH